MQEIKNYVGKRIREIREDKGITQKKLGEVLGYSAMGISHFENGIRDLKISDLKKIAQFFNTELSYFFPPQNRVTQPTFFRYAGKEDPGVQKSLDDFEKFLEQQNKNEQ